MQGDKVMPKAPLARNIRPIQDTNGRSIRTNIAFDNARSTHLDRRSKAGKKNRDGCPEVVKDTFYKANSWKGDS